MTVDITGNKDFISIFDAAIDWGAMPIPHFQKYLDRREDLSLLEPYRIPGVEPTVYTLREVPNDIWFSFVKTAANMQMLKLRAFMASVVSVRNLRSKDGALLGAEYELPKHESGVVKEEALKRLPKSHVEDLMEVAYSMSFFQDSIEFTYLSPPTLLEMWDAMAARRAAANQNSQAQSSAEASQG